jgi:hypothetical protein
MKSIFHFKFKAALWFAIFLFSLLCQGQNAKAQEIPNGDNDVLWERGLIGHDLGDARFHPINGNIITIIDNEIWELDPKDGHTIRVFEGETGMQYWYGWMDITQDGKYILLSTWDKGLTLWDYSLGKFIKEFPIKSETTVGIFPNSNNVFIHLSNKLVIYDFVEEKIIKETGTNPYYIDIARLSNDGKYIAIGFRYRPQSDMIYTMELWDAETLTKIRDFGNTSSDVVEFRDVQISNDNQYIGFVTAGDGVKLHLFNSTNTFPIKVFENFSSFSFSNDSKKLFYSSSTNLITDFVTQVMLLPNFDTVYQYLKAGSGVFNKENDMFTTGFVSIQTGPTMKLLSNHWYEVGVSNPQETESILYPNPASEYITVIVQNIETIQGIEIYDIFGEGVLSVETQNFVSLQKIDVSSLPPGVYIVRVGNEKPMKFVVVR